MFMVYGKIENIAWLSQYKANARNVRIKLSKCNVDLTTDIEEHACFMNDDLERTTFMLKIWTLKTLRVTLIALRTTTTSTYLVCTCKWLKIKKNIAYA